MSDRSFCATVQSVNKTLYDSHIRLFHCICNDYNLGATASQDIEAAYLNKSIFKKMVRKDKNTLIKVRSAYILFGNSIRSSVVYENPTANNMDVIRIIARKWKLLSIDDKIPYNEMYEIDKERYLRETMEYANTQQTYIGKSNQA